MRPVYVEIKNMLGLPHRHFVLDLQAQRHRLILILGPNGSGKSTLVKALSPFPDSPSQYIDGVEGSKKIVYDKRGIMYTIQIFYPVNSRGDRGQTKAFIRRDNGDEDIELNPNGNITSFKETLYREFEMDASAIQLTHLSAMNTGLATLTPAERKSLVASQLEQTQIYNDIYKAINPKALSLNHSMKSIATEMGFIGTQEDIQKDINNTLRSLNSVEAEIDKCNHERAACEAMIDTLDPDKSIRTRHATLMRLQAEETHEVRTRKSLLGRYLELHKSASYLRSEIETLEGGLHPVELQLNTARIKYDDRTTNINTQLKKKRKLEEEVASMEGEVNFVDYSSEIARVEIEIQSIRDIFSSTVQDLTQLPTEEEYNALIKLFGTLANTSAVLKSYTDESSLSMAIKLYREGNSPYDLIRQVQDKIGQQNLLINRIEMEEMSYRRNKEDMEVLKLRPTSCKVDTCPFIEKAIAALNRNPDGNLNRLAEEKEKVQATIVKLNAELEWLRTVEQAHVKITQMMKLVLVNGYLLTKIPNRIANNPDMFLNLLNNYYPFNVEKELYESGYNDKMNRLRVYKADMVLLPQLKEKQARFEASRSNSALELKRALLYEINCDVESLQTEIKELEAELNDLTARKNRMSQTLKEWKTLLTSFEELEDHQSKLTDIEDSLGKLAASISTIEEKIKEGYRIKDLERQALDKKRPLLERLDQLRVNKARLQDYQDRYNSYLAEFNKHQLIRKYTTPTKEGIQNVFIEMHFGNTIQIANNVLSSCFSSDLYLERFNIGEREFSITCRHNSTGSVNEDISSCSDGEKAILGLILSFSLMVQASKCYNVLRLDEIDAQLDNYNRSQFLGALNVIMNKLGVDSCFLISHSPEIDISDADTIILDKENDPAYQTTPNTIYHA